MSGRTIEGSRPKAEGSSVDDDIEKRSDEEPDDAGNGEL